MASPRQVPVDIVVNYLISAAWTTAKQHWGKTVPSDADPKIFNCTINPANPVFWRQWVDTSNDTYVQYPLDKGALRVPGLYMVEAKSPTGLYGLLYRWSWHASHTLPVRFFALLEQLVGQQPSVQRTMDRLDSTINGDYNFFVNHQYKFSFENGHALMAEMSEEDRATFNIDTKDLHWPTYIKTLLLGLRKYVVKGDLSEAGMDRGRALARKVWLRGLLGRTITTWVALRLVFARLFGLPPRKTWMYALVLAIISKLWRQSAQKVAFLTAR